MATCHFPYCNAPLSRNEFGYSRKYCHAHRVVIRDAQRKKHYLEVQKPKMQKKIRDRKNKENRTCCGCKRILPMSRSLAMKYCSDCKRIRVRVTNNNSNRAKITRQCFDKIRESLKNNMIVNEEKLRCSPLIAYLPS